MAIVSKTWTATGDGTAVQRQSDSLALGAGKDTHLPVGRFTGGGTFIGRSFLKFGPTYPAAGQLTEAKLYVKVSSAHSVLGASARVKAHRCTAAVSVGSSGGDETFYNGNALNWDNMPAVGGTVSTVANPPSSGWLAIDVTALIDEILPAEILRLSGAAGSGTTFYGLRLQACDSGGTTQEASTAYYSEFASQDSANKPYIVAKFDDNAAPTAPTVSTLRTQSDGSPAIEGSALGTTAVVAWAQNDTDAGDTTSKRQHQVYADAATDGTPGTAIKDTTFPPTGTGTSTSGSDTLTGLPARTIMRERSRTADAGGKWGPYTGLADGRFQTAYKPGVPTNPSPAPGGTISDGAAFHIGGSISSPDSGDYITGWEGEFYKDTSSGSVPMWTPGAQTIGGVSTRSDITYVGTAYLVGEIVRRRQRHANRDGVWGDWSSWYYSTVSAQTGPTALSPADRTTKLLARSGPLTIADAAAFTSYQWRLYRAGALIYDSQATGIGSTSSTQVTIPTGVASWGDDLEWEASVRGEAFSQKLPIYINALPDAPVGTVSA